MCYVLWSTESFVELIKEKQILIFKSRAMLNIRLEFCKQKIPYTFYIIGSKLHYFLDLIGYTEIAVFT
jgi:hypothetical protein